MLLFLFPHSQASNNFSIQSSVKKVKALSKKSFFFLRKQGGKPIMKNTTAFKPMLNNEKVKPNCQQMNKQTHFRSLILTSNWTKEIIKMFPAVSLRYLSFYLKHIFHKKTLVSTYHLLSSWQLFLRGKKKKDRIACSHTPKPVARHPKLKLIQKIQCFWLISHCFFHVANFQGGITPSKICF